MVKKKRQSKPGDDCGESTESCEENMNQSCQHINKAVSNSLQKNIKAIGLKAECTECDSKPFVGPVTEESWEKDNSEGVDSNLWLCLQCGSQLCSRSKRRHALDHYSKPHSDRHDLVANTSTWEVYCYTCQRVLQHSANRKLQEAIEFLKKQNVTNNKIRDVNIDDKVVIKSEVSISSYHDSHYGSSPGVSGLYNFGNTCFFNSVVQCLVRTPYLTEVLRRGSLGGAKMRLEGGKLKIDERELELSPIQGELGTWGTLTEVLATTLETLASPGSGGVFKPTALYKSFVSQFPQFGDLEQHDSHELLRQLLEGVRNEDLHRYQAVVLKKLELDSKEKRSSISNEKRQIVKFYGQRAAEKLLGPEQVFRGLLVSTLECQECQHTSDRTETFLDLSLPVTAEKPQPPAVTRRKGIPEEQGSKAEASDESKPSKHQLKKQREEKRKARKNRGYHGSGDAQSPTSSKQEDGKENSDVNENKTESKSSSEQSDADVEDNIEENTNNEVSNKISNDSVEAPTETAANFALYHMESGYNSEKLISSDSIRTSPVDLENKEKSDASPERLDKNDEPFCLSAMAIPLEYRPLSGVDSPHLDSGVASPDAGKSDTPQATSKELGSPSSLSSEINMDMSSPRQDVSPDNDAPRPALHISFDNADSQQADDNKSEPSTSTNGKLDKVITGLDEFKINDEASTSNRGAVMKYSPSLTLCVNDNLIYDVPASPDYELSKWKKNTSYFPNTVSPRYQCDEGEYSVQSCLNQFTSSELLAGNNKVGCEACTKRANSEKTIYTNATKRFLISSPPAVLILHLKRFQIGPRCVFRKITKHVNFPLILDLAPFCSDKIKSLPMVSPNQTKLLYSLYGVVEHSGSMHGGHYVAYVKVRPKVDAHDKRWSFLPKDVNVDEDMDDEDDKGYAGNGVNGNGSDSSMSGYESEEGATGYTPEAPPGKWYFISDSRVHEIAQDKVLKTQAYLLFYERIM